VLTVSGGNGFAGTEAAVTGGFADIDSLVGGAGTDSLTGLNAPATWDLGGTDTYTNNTGGNTLVFSSFETFIGNGDVDVFNFSRAYAGNVSGAGGADVFNFNAGGVVTGAVAGNAGNDAFHFNGGNLIGAGTGDAGDDSFTLDDPASVVAATLDAGTTGETAGDVIVGSPNPDTFAFAGVTTTLSNGSGGSLAVDNVENLGGGAGADVFTITSPFAGRIDGDAGADILDLSAIATQQTATLTSANADGFTGTETSVAGGFADIDDIRVGASGNDTIVGLDAAGAWDFAINRYTSGGNVLAFLGFENVTGGSAADTFSFVGAGTRGNILGGAGDDDFSFDGNWTVTAANGGAGDDTFRLATASTVVTGNIDAGSGGETNGDTVVGPATATTFLVAGPGVAALTASPGTITVSNVENLTGGAGADTFAFSGAGNLTGVATGAGGADTFDLDVAIAGRVDGGAGTDVLDLSSIATARNVTLASANGNGFTGTEAAVAGGGAGGFANIDDVRGGAAANDALTGLNATSTWARAGTSTYATGGNTLAFSSFEAINAGTGADTLVGDNIANAFVLTGANQGTLNGGTFTGIENLTGNAQADTFALTGGTLTGAIDGAAGSDTLTGDNVQNGFAVTGTNAGTATGTGGFANIENLTGNAQPDTFTLAGGTL
ncbi:MAG TPA: calcium-binding protein, partial [Thermomicrobiales bacterium]|nr:calcium-binding protein [Thermomicrobiales bacterium]